MSFYVIGFETQFGGYRRLRKEGEVRGGQIETTHCFFNPKGGLPFALDLQSNGCYLKKRLMDVFDINGDAKS